MNNIKRNLLVALSLVATLAAGAKDNTPTLKETVGKYFYIGAAVNTSCVWERNTVEANIVKDNFNSIVAENCMKGEVIHPEENRYDWRDADQTVAFAEKYGLTVFGHCLVWHSQPPRWMFTDDKGKPVTREVLIDRMYHHITTVVSHYRGRIKGWDVVNEAFNDDGTLRHTPYYNIIGPDYIELAFRFAHAADPDAELYYNDYNLSTPAKRDGVCKLVRALKAKGIRIDAVGMQSHNGYNYPDLNNYEASIDSFAACGVKVQMTELDINMLPNPKSFGGAEISQRYQYNKEYNPYVKGLDKKAQKVFDSRYLALFDIYRRHAAQIERVTLWGVTDATSWLNDWPIPGRTNYPLLFDRAGKAKKVVKEICKKFQPHPLTPLQRRGE